MLTPLAHWSAFLGIDVNIKDNRGLTALDTVRELPSQKSQQIAALIEGIGPPPCGRRRQATVHAADQGICIWCSFLLLSSHVDHMTEKRGAKEADEAPSPQPPLLSSADSTPQKSQGKAAVLRGLSAGRAERSSAEWKILT